jgi:hypothetical protein
MIGIVLVSKDWYYLGKDGELPDRPALDKKFLLRLCKGKRCLCSENTYKDLPPSLFKKAKSISTYTDTYDLDCDINLGIGTFKTEIPQTFYIIQSDKNLNDGKAFQQDWLKENYRLLVKDTYLSIWERKQ